MHRRGSRRDFSIAAAVTPMHILRRRKVRGFFVRAGVWPLLVVGLAGCPQPPFDIEPAGLPNGAQDLGYEVLLTAPGAGPRVRWEITEGGLPGGLDLESETGRISGTPVDPGTFEFAVLARDLSTLAARTGARSYQLVIIPKLTVGGALAPARVGEPYNQPIQITGGIAPYQVTVIGLPAGLTIDQTTDSITGTPVTAGDGLRLDISVVDSGTPQQTAAITTQLMIDPPPVSITTTALPPGTQNVSYSAQLQATGGRPPYLWGFLTSAPGTLPTGLMLNQNTGLISGTPTQAGTSTFTIRITDSDSPITSDTQEFSITVNP
jgi:hypothetical protein